METINFWQFIAGLSFFLFGMTQLENSLNRLSGRSLKIFLRKYTKNPLSAIGVGTVVTAILQSSSVVVLMLLALVGSGILHLHHALGVIIGSNLGTTFTGWLVTTLGFKFKIDAVVMPLIAIGGLTAVFIKKHDKINQIGKALLGFGMLFYGLNHMKEGVEAFKTVYAFTNPVDFGILVFALIGFVFTAIIQSSSATMVITLSALSSGLISIHSAAAIVVGADLGTTITGLIGSLGGNIERRRVSYAHFFFNVVTDLIAMILLFPLIKFSQWFVGADNELLTLVFFHSSFNVVGIILFIPFVKKFAVFLETKFHESKLSEKFIDTKKSISNFPQAELETLKNEVYYFLQLTTDVNSMILEVPEKYKQRPLPEWIDYHGHDLISRYYYLKDKEGRMVNYIHKIQNKELDENLSKSAMAIQNTVRFSVLATKSLKDIEHDLQEFRDSTYEPLNRLCEDLKKEFHVLYKEYYLIISQLIIKNYDGHNGYEENLKKLESINLQVKSSNQEKINQYISKGQAKFSDISSLLNVNEELYASSKFLLKALRFYPKG